MPTKTTQDYNKIAALLDHPRASTEWLVAAFIHPTDGLSQHRIARICTVYPRDGAARLRTVVSDWANGPDPIHFLGVASGYGYDKRTAALAGSTVAGVALLDHGRRGTGVLPSQICYSDAVLEGVRRHFGLPDDTQILVDLI
jgi:hypothetical protein